MRRFEGKRVIITGGANGIGKATVARFAAEGAAIVLTDVNGAAAEAAAQQIAGETGATIYPFAADVSVKADDQATIRFALEKMGGVDVLVNNAGIYYEDHFEEITEARWDSDHERGSERYVSDDPGGGAALQGEACRVSSSTWRRPMGWQGEIYYAHYNAAKGGVVLLTKTLALELGPFNIRINCVCPGYIVTESTAGHGQR